MALAAAVLPHTAAVAEAQRLSLAWDRSHDSNTAGYRLYAGNRSGEYPWSVDVGGATSAPLPELASGSSYYFVVRAYNAAGQEGPASNEVAVDTSPPGVPTALTATVDGSRVTISWQPPVQGAAAARYLVSVGRAPGAADLVNAVNVGVSRSAAGELGPGRYFARVQAANSRGAGPATADVPFAVGGSDQTGNPSGLTATWHGTQVTLRWTPAAGAATHVIEAGTAPGAANVGRIGVGAVASHTVDVPPGTYYVRIRAATAIGLSAPSNEVVLQGRGAPEPPGHLTGRVRESMIELQWNAPGTGAPPTGYVLEAGTAPGLANVGTVRIAAATAFSTPLPAGAAGAFYVRVRAINQRGASAPSNEIVVRP